MALLNKKVKNTNQIWPTAMKALTRDGRAVGVDRSVWLYRAVPLAPVVDARSPEEGLATGDPIQGVIEEIASHTRTRVSRRAASKGAYRDVHILLVNIPSRYRPPLNSPLYSYLSASFSNVTVDRRMLVMGVKLQSSISSGESIQDSVTSFAQSLVSGQPPMSDFDKDYSEMSAIMSRNGLMTISTQDYSLLNGWWNYGQAPDTPYLTHLDHLHIFRSPDSMRAAATIMKEDSEIKCEEWGIEQGHHTITFGCIRDFELEYAEPTDWRARWGASLVDRGALCISTRGKIEPSHITRVELRRRKKNYIDDINERRGQNKMRRQEQDDLLAQLSEMEGIYAVGGPATLMDAGTIVAVGGYDKRTGYDIGNMGQDIGVVVDTMNTRQDAAIQETMLCSPVRSVPHLHDIPSHTLAAAGLTAQSIVGDQNGALLGFTERDHQPAYLSPTAAADEDSLSLAIIVGQSGSGKLTPNRTRIPTPSGWTTMGELKVGDEVFGDNGEVCSVQEIFENPTPVLYDIHLSDNQVITACKDHQWLVSNWQDRNKVHHPKRNAAHSNWKSAQVLMSELLTLAEQYSDSDMLTSDELLDATSHLDTSWNTRFAISTALDFVDCSSDYGKRVVTKKNSKKESIGKYPAVLFPLRPTLEACIVKWQSPGAANAVRWSSKFASKIEAAQEMLIEFDDNEELTVAEIARRLIERGAVMSHTSKSMIANYARAAGVTGRRGLVEVESPLPETSESTRVVRVWSAPLAMKHLALRVSLMFSEEPRTDAEQRVLSTEEMLVSGIKKSGRDSEFAIAITSALQMPEVGLPVDPYVLGMWLGDGSRGSGSFTQGATESCTDEFGLTDQHHMLQQLENAGIDANLTTNSGKTIGARKLHAKLRDAGVLNRKHIPINYLRASESQRLALLQGLMDTDGTIDVNGSCELCLCDETLVHDSLELIRSLGIKASISSSDAMITELDPENPGKKRRRVTGTRWRIHFTTDKPVFRLPRKAARLPKSVRETQKWLYINDITPAPSEPGRCITVDSPNHTFLVEGFVPTHNTQTMLYLADQFARMTTAYGEKSPVIIIDPKSGSHHDAAVRASGGVVNSLDDLIFSDGVFDPMRFSSTMTVGVELSSTMLLAINPWGTMKDDYETPLIKALAYGAEQGADCIGEALQIAVRDGQAPHEMVQKVFDLAGASAMFRACVGMNHGGARLRTSEGITLIKVGEGNLDLPEPGSVHEATQQQRIALALVRMMVFGSAAALSMRSGVLMLDEAWVMLSAGRSEMNRLGRLARSQQVLPLLFTQKVSDALDAGLAGYIGRGIILPIQDRFEAEAACELFRLEATDERMERITAKAYIGGNTETSTAPNWGSMRALRDQNGVVLRGAIGIYVDLAGRAVPVEIKIPKAFLDKSSTNPEDIRRREAQKNAV